MPAVPQDQGYAIEMQIEETITTPFVVFQTAVLHTTCYGLSLSLLFLYHYLYCTRIGERRIRVVTLALPTTTNLSEVFASADQVAIATLLADKAVERSLTHKLEDAREHVYQKLVDILVAYKVCFDFTTEVGLVVTDESIAGEYDERRCGRECSACGVG